jgi:hypothetical protein
MTLMALTYRFVEDSVLGNWQGKLFNITLDTSYPTGGYLIAPTKVQLGKTILGVQILAVNAAGSGIVQVSWDYANNKLMAFRVATFTPAGTVAAPTFTGAAHAHDMVFKANPAANAVTMAANSLRNATAGDLTVAGAGADGGIQNTTATGTNSVPAFTGGAQGQIAFAQVSNAVNLSAVTVRCLFIGR